VCVRVCSLFSVTILRSVVKSKLHSCIFVAATFINITSSEALDTVNIPWSSRWNWSLRLKHVERFAEINEFCNVASCWLYFKIHLRCTDPRTLNRTLNLVPPSFLWASYVSLPFRFTLQCLLGYPVVSLLCKCYGSSVDIVVLPGQILHTQLVPNGLIPFPI
jgi:hypothetical protein